MASTTEHTGADKVKSSMLAFREETWLNHGKRSPINSSVKIPSYTYWHMDSDPENAPQQKARRVQENRRPPHAVESAFMGRDIQAIFNASTPRTL